MLGTCNTCVRLESTVASSGATVDGLFLFVSLFVYLFAWGFFVCSFLLLSLLLFCFYYYLLFFSLEFWGWGDGVEALIRKILGFLGGAGHYNLCWPE